MGSAGTVVFEKGAVLVAGGVTSVVEGATSVLEGEASGVGAGADTSGDEGGIEVSGVGASGSESVIVTVTTVGCLVLHAFGYTGESQS